MANIEAGGGAAAPPAKSRSHLLLAKFVYFFVFAADASWEPFAAYFLSTRNIQTKTIGVLLTAMTICNACAGQVLTAAADHYRAHRAVALASFAAFVVFTCSMYFNHSLWWTAVVGVLAQCAWGPMLPMIDNVTVQLVQGTSEDYSKQRLGGAIAWAVFCFGDGWVMKLRGPDAILEVMFAAGVVAFALLWHYPFEKFAPPPPPPAATNPASDAANADARAGAASSGLFFLDAPLRLISANLLIVPFLSIIVCIGYLFGTIDGYLALWVVQLGGTSQLVGAMYAVASVVEIPLFFYSDAVYQRVGVRVILFISCAAYTVRVVSYALLQNPLMVLCVEPLHALTIALFYGPCVTYVNDTLLADLPDLKATGQGSFFASFYLGRAIGYVLAGWLSDFGGMRFMFRSTLIAVGVLVALVFNFCAVEKVLSSCGKPRFKHARSYDELASMVETQPFTAETQPFTAHCINTDPSVGIIPVSLQRKRRNLEAGVVYGAISPPSPEGPISTLG